MDASGGCANGAIAGWVTVPSGARTVSRHRPSSSGAAQARKPPPPVRFAAPGDGARSVSAWAAGAAAAASTAAARKALTGVEGRMPVQRGAGAEVALGARSGGELDGDHVAVVHHVVAALEPERAALACPGVAAGVDERLPADDLGADEALLDVRVDLAGGVPRGQAVAEVPRLRGLVLPGGEERDEVQEREGSRDDAL